MCSSDLGISVIEVRQWFPEDAESIQDHEDGAAFVPDDSQPQWQLEERGDHQCGDHGEGEDHILPDSSPGLAADPDGQWQGFEIIAHQDDVGDFKCDIRSGAAHGDTEMCGGECRGIIHAIADHGHGVAGCGQLSDLYDLLIGQ